MCSYHAYADPPFLPAICLHAELASERAALLAIFATWGSPSSLSSWTFRHNPCDGSWADVSCTDGIVTSVDVCRMSLQNQLDPAVGSLTGLVFLKVEHNSLTGQLPSTMSALANLQEFAVSVNQVTGVIPTWFSALTSLTGLYLGNKQEHNPLCPNTQKRVLEVHLMCAI